MKVTPLETAPHVTLNDFIKALEYARRIYGAGASPVFVGIQDQATGDTTLVIPAVAQIHAELAPDGAWKESEGEGPLRAIMIA
jgi:hypothetical protein